MNLLSNLGTRPIHRNVVSSCALSLLCAVALAVPGRAQSTGTAREMRKPAHTALHEGHELDRIYVKFRDDLGVRCTDGALREVDAGALDEARALLERYASGRWVRQHAVGDVQLEELRRSGEELSAASLIDMRTEFRLFLPAGVDAAGAIDAWNALECVELAEGVLRPAPAPNAPDFHARQLYLAAAPGGVGIVPARVHPGSEGAFSRIVDVEYSFDALHPETAGIVDLVPNGYDPFNDTNHGTAVLSMLGGVPDMRGTSGACPLARRWFASAANLTSGHNIALAITTALTSFRSTFPVFPPPPGRATGDVILLEQQAFGPGSVLVPCEWQFSVYQAIRTAVALGVTVVEAAGNGGQDLDAPAFQSGHAPFVPANDSGAILVGAGASPAGSDLARSRLWFSNFGATVDLQGWGENVVSAGYGDLYNGGAHELYTQLFNGTSSASPMVAAACAMLQSIHYSASGAYLAPAQVRELLRASGTAQQNGAYPAWQSIGPLPDVNAAVARLELNRCDPATAWRAVNAPLGPFAPRSSMALACDPLRQPAGLVLVFGGLNAAGQRLGDTLGLTGTPSAWTQLGIGPHPSARFDSALAFDAARARFVLFGGDDGTPAPNKTWEFDPVANAWSQAPVFGPVARSAHALAYHSGREVCVLFGGLTPGGVALGDTWIYDGMGWRPAAVSTPPSPRYAHSMVYDPLRRRLVLFGGHAANGAPLGDTWEWDGGAWTQIATSGGPSARFSATLVYDASRAKCVLNGGSSNVGGGLVDTWTWDGAQWRSLLFSTPAPAGRYRHGAAYDPRSESIVVFGGNTSAGVVGDTWRLQTEREPGAPTCFGDGAAANCPCNNNSPRGVCAGCRNSSGTYGRLRATGLARLSDDEVVLSVTGVTSSIALFVQGDPLSGAPGPLVGDGLECLAGAQRVLGSRPVFNSAASLGRISSRGLVQTPRTCEYQVVYRNPTGYCTPSLLNTSNAYRIAWTP